MIFFKLRNSLRYYSHNLFHLGFGLNLLSPKRDQPQISPIAPCKGIRPLNPGNFCHGIQDPGLWTPEHNSKNPEPTDDWNPESGTWNPESRIHGCGI